MTDEPAPPTPPDDASATPSPAVEPGPTGEGASGSDANAASTTDAAPFVAPPLAAPPSPSELTAKGAPVPPRPRPALWFLAVVSLVSLGLDLGSKAWAKTNLDDPHVFPYKKIELVKNHVALVFAKNKGGAWGLLQDENESLRRPFFLAISAAAVIFIVTLYRKLTPGQTALKWGLPLVLGGALGNLVDRIRYSHVIDFIDLFWGESHWPTFNVADIAICVGVGLMAVDMFTSRKPAVPPAGTTAAQSPAPAPAPPPEHAPADSGGNES